MDLKSLIEQARAKSLVFDAEYMYNVEFLHKQPSLYWLMPRLERALGKAYVQKAAQEFIDSVLSKEEQANVTAKATEKAE